MSHLKKRLDTTCLNCGAEVPERYCQRCGQENIEPKETVGHLFLHFVYDITHFDSKFFDTLKYLLFNPGFLSRQYLLGKRNSYLNPIKMYVFISAIFFLFFFYFIQPSINNSVPDRQKEPVLNKEFTSLTKALSDTSAKNKNKALLHLQNINTLVKKKLNDSLIHPAVEPGLSKSATFGRAVEYSSVSDYDSVQSGLPVSKRDSRITRFLMHRSIKIMEKYGDETGRLINDALNKFFHSFPKIFFLSLPIFALILLLLYKRHPDFYFVDHLIFSVHIYCAIFILLLFEALFSFCENWPYLSWLHYFQWIITFYVVVYLFLAMKNFYRQSIGKTLAKMLILVFIDAFILIFLFTIFFVGTLLSL